MRKSTFIFGQLLAVLLLGITAFALGSCRAVNSPNRVFAPAGPAPREFRLVTKNGVQVACPKDWHVDPASDPRLVFEVSRDQNTRITVAVLDALPQSYYDGLVAQGTVTRTTIAGETAYVNGSTYPCGDCQLTSQCITIVRGSKVCHIMFLCDVSTIQSYLPVLDYVTNSVRFVSKS